MASGSTALTLIGAYTLPTGASQVMQVGARLNLWQTSTRTNYGLMEFLCSLQYNGTTWVMSTVSASPRLNDTVAAHGFSGQATIAAGVLQIRAYSTAATGSAEVKMWTGATVAQP
jgi:hypothetical protein